MTTTMSRACRAHGCSQDGADRHFYCPEHFKALVSGLLETIETIHPYAGELYIGRTHYPEKRLLEQRQEADRDHLAVLHWAGHQDEISFLERLLIARTKDRHPLKTANESLESDGGWAGHWNCVYVAWQWKDGVRRPWPGFTEVKGLDLGRRLCPERGALVKRPDYLFTLLTTDAAKREVDSLNKKGRSGNGRASGRRGGD